MISGIRKPGVSGLLHHKCYGCGGRAVHAEDAVTQVTPMPLVNVAKG